MRLISFIMGDFMRLFGFLVVHMFLAGVIRMVWVEEGWWKLAGAIFMVFYVLYWREVNIQSKIKPPTK